MPIKQLIARTLFKWAGYNPIFGAGLQYSFGNAFNWNNTPGNDIIGYNNKIVFTATNLLNKKYTEPPIIVSQVKNAQKLKNYYSKSISNEKRVLLKATSMTELDNHPLLTLLEKPNDFQTGIELWSQFWFNYIFGDGYLIALNDSNDSPGPDSRKYKPTKLYAPNRNRVIPFRSKDRFNSIQYYQIMLQNGEELKLDPSSVLHMSKWNPEWNDLYGFGFQNAAGKTIAESEANMVARGSAFVNGGRGTLFSSDIGTAKGTGDQYERMPAESMKALSETMQRDYAGAANNRRMHFTNGYVDVQNFGDTLAEMELIDADKANWRDIFAVLGIPISLGPTGEATTDNNMETGYKALVTNTIVPDLQKLDMKLKYWVAPWFGEDIIAIHDLTVFRELAPDLALLKAVYGDAPYLTFNEKRVLFQFDTDDKTPGMNGYYLPSGLMTLEAITDPLPPPDPDAKQYDYLN